MDNLNDAKIPGCTVDVVRAHIETPIGKLEPAQCYSPVQLGLFFDGTQNNKVRDQEKYAHSNIARLHDTYPELQRIGIFKEYIPGVGTIFPEIGDTDESGAGSAFGIGCEARVLYALLRTIDIIHIHAFKRPLIGSVDVKALCKAPSLFAWDSNEKKISSRFIWRNCLFVDQS